MTATFHDWFNIPFHSAFNQPLQVWFVNKQERFVPLFNISLHWLDLSFLCALFVQWSILATKLNSSTPPSSFPRFKRSKFFSLYWGLNHWPSDPVTDDVPRCHCASLPNMPEVEIDVLLAKKVIKYWLGYVYLDQLSGACHSHIFQSSRSWI